jgi:hypothetical protein
LAVQDLGLDAQQRARIEACTDPDMLTEWLRRAVMVTHVDEILSTALTIKP